MFKFINPQIESLKAEVDLLREQNLTLETEAIFLRSQLELERIEKKEILDKLFQVTGISSRSNSIPSKSENRPIAIGKSTKPWAQVKETLEKVAYWEAKNTKQAPEKIEELEKELEVASGEAKESNAS